MSSRRIALRFPRGAMTTDLRQILEGIQRYAEQAGQWHCVRDPFAGSGSAIDYDGVIAPGDSGLWKRLQAAGVPAVFVGWQASVLRMPRVAEGRFQAGTLVGKHLVDREYLHFGYVGLSYKYASSRLEETFRRALHTRGRGCDSVLLSVRSVRKAKRWRRHGEILGEWLDTLSLPAGVLCVDDALAHTLAEAALAKGLRVPEDVGIVGAGNDPLYCNWPPCRLTSVEFDYEAVGRRAARLLDRFIDSGVPATRNLYILPRLVPRASTDRRFRHDPVVAKAVAWIAAHCHEPMRVGDVAEAVGVGQRHLRRRLQRVRDRTVRQEIVLARLARARDILAATALSQGEVARACGFVSERAFARAFRRYHGAAPGACRDARPDAPRVPDPLEVAKHRLATREESISCVAFFSGFRTLHRMRKAFWLHEHMSPREWRKLHRQPPPDLPPYTVTTTFIGPDGEIEDERTHEVPAGRPARASRRQQPRDHGAGGPVTLTFIGPDGEVDEQEDDHGEGAAAGRPRRLGGR